jgi:hypothetical protein
MIVVMILGVVLLLIFLAMGLTMMGDGKAPPMSDRDLYGDDGGARGMQP